MFLFFVFLSFYVVSYIASYAINRYSRKQEIIIVFFNINTKQMEYFKFFGVSDSLTHIRFSEFYMDRQDKSYSDVLSFMNYLGFFLVAPQPIYENLLDYCYEFVGVFRRITVNNKIKWKYYDNQHII